MSVRNYINKSKEDVIFFLKKACADHQSAEYAELYGNLLKMFVDCDKNKNGLVAKAQFSELVDTAAETPRRYGFAPSSADMFASKQEMEASRSTLFDSMDYDSSGTITFDEFLKYALTHITCKAAPLDAHPNIETNNKSVYTANMELALKRGNEQYIDLYWYLLQTWLSHCGRDFCATKGEFTVMVSKVVLPARRLGLFNTEMKMDVVTKIYKKLVRAEKMNFNEFLAYCTGQLLKNNTL
jgi:Ca2+-binding EF-hand superfamily protein